MFDIGFAELILIGVVGLLVIGPERLPSAIRTGSLWLNRIRRGFNDIKQEVQQELHNDGVMQELREAGQQLKNDTQRIGQDLTDSAKPLSDALTADEQAVEASAAPTPVSEKPATAADQPDKAPAND